jgi:hypothetical protein
MVGVSLITEARAAGLELRVDAGGRLTIRGPRAAAALAQKLLERKADVVEALTRAATAPTERWPIIPGHEHFSIWVDSADGPWPEFIPGYHYDIRQTSRLRPLLDPKGQCSPSMSHKRTHRMHQGLLHECLIGRFSEAQLLTTNS